MSTFVPGGEAGKESQRITRDEELQAVHRAELEDVQRPQRPSVVKRILGKLRRAQ